MLRDHPDIERAEATGYGYTDAEQPVCPVCGEECNELYFDIYRKIVGCDNCIETRDAWECLDLLMEDYE